MPGTPCREWFRSFLVDLRLWRDSSKQKRRDSTPATYLWIATRLVALLFGHSVSRSAVLCQWVRLDLDLLPIEHAVVEEGEGHGDVGTLFHFDESEAPAQARDFVGNGQCTNRSARGREMGEKIPAGYGAGQVANVNLGHNKPPALSSVRIVPS